MGSVIRYVKLFVIDLNQSRSALRSCNKILFSKFELILSLLVHYFLVFAYLCLKSWRHRSCFQQVGGYTFPFFHKVVLGFRIWRCRMHFL